MLPHRNIHFYEIKCRDTFGDSLIIFVAVLPHRNIQEIHKDFHFEAVLNGYLRKDNMDVFVTGRSS